MANISPGPFDASSNPEPSEAPPPYEDLREQPTLLPEKDGKIPSGNANQQDEHNPDNETLSHFSAQPTLVDSKQGELQSLAQSAGTGRLPAQQRMGRGGTDKTLASLANSWRYHRQEFGSVDPRTINRLFDLCRYWKTLGVFREAVATEAPQILSWTIKAGDTAFFNFLLQQGVDVNQPDEEGETPLFHASTLGSAFMVRRLLDSGANAQCAAGTVTPLHISAEKNDTLISVYLLDAGADANALNPKGKCALFWASNNGNIELVRKLLGKGAQVNNAALSAIFPLHAAAARGHVEIVEILLDAGAEINAPNFDMTPVLVAISYQHEGVLDRLLARGAAANPRLGDDFALHFATRKGSRKIVTLLLDAGVAVDTMSTKGYTALHIAAAQGNEDLIDRLLARSASVNFKSPSGFTALHEASLAGHIVVVKQLLFAGADIASTTRTGFTALHAATEKGFLDVVKLLLSWNADLDPSDTASSLSNVAAREANEKVVKRLVDNRINVNAQSTKKWTPLLCACHQKNLALVELLLKYGAKPDLADCQGHTPLILASELGELGMVRTLVCDYSADVDGHSLHGLTALHMAAQHGHTSVVSFLLSKGANANMLFLGNTTPLAMATWNLHVDNIARLVPVTEDPLLLDCFGWNSIDRATADETALSKFRLETRPEKYIHTSTATRKSQARQNISNLARSMLQSRTANDMRLCVLGICLLIMHDMTDAEHAFQLDLRDYDATTEGPLPYTIRCDLCDTSVTGNLYMCLTCADKGLCEDCMTKYKEKTKELRNCKDHAFHGILSHRHWEGDYSEWPLQLVNTRGQTVDGWLRHVLAGYGGEEME